MAMFHDLDINAKLPIIRVDWKPREDQLELPNKIEIKKPSFRLVEEYEHRNRIHTAFKAKKQANDAPKDKDSYFHYEEPSADDLLNTVEYDMDEHDIAWLNKFNEKHLSKYHYRVSDSDFEKIMDRLEKESYFEFKRSVTELDTDKADADACCAICNDGDCDNNVNVIIFCEMCNLAVHQECYGVPYVPEGAWLCRRCLQSPSQNVSCALCPNKGGAFKQTDDNRWAHVICALWIPEVCFANTVFLEPIDSLHQIPAARWKLNCYICKQKRSGACIQCHKPNCYQPFHVTCAQQAGLYMKIRTCKYDTPDGPITDVKKEAFCDLHDPTDGRRRAAMYEGDETDEEEINTHAYKKWKQKKKDKMKKTRKILTEKRQIDQNQTADPKVPDEKLLEISNMLLVKGKRKIQEVNEIRELVIRHMQGYWNQKRKARNGVPLLRRLQVSLNSNISRDQSIQIQDHDAADRYQRLRYDLEKSRLLVGEVKKREVMKKKLIQITKEIINHKFNVIDIDFPPTDE